MHREFNFPAQGFDDGRRCNLVTLRIVQYNFQMRTLLEGCHLDVDVYTIPIRIRLGCERCNASFFGGHSLELIFREKEIHLFIITKRNCLLSPESRQLDYSSISERL